MYLILRNLPWKVFKGRVLKPPSLHIYEEVFKYYVWMGGDLSQNADMADIVGRGISVKMLTLEIWGLKHNSR